MSLRDMFDAARFQYLIFQADRLWATSLFENGYTENEIIQMIDEKRGAAPATPQQAEPVAWAVFDPSGEAIYAALFKTRCVEYVDNEYRYGHGAAKHWAVRPAFAHPPAEVQRLRDALKPFAAIDLTTNQAVDPMDVLRARRALRRE